MKKTLLLLLMIVITISSTSTIFAEDEINVIVNGESVNFDAPSVQ